ncbi:hypothetical protein Tco_0476292 [Tanacetum coccineum]
MVCQWSNILDHDGRIHVTTVWQALQGSVGIKQTTQLVAAVSNLFSNAALSAAAFEALYGQKCRSHRERTECGEKSLLRSVERDVKKAKQRRIPIRQSSLGDSRQGAEYTGNMKTNSGRISSSFSSLKTEPPSGVTNLA